MNPHETVGTVITGINALKYMFLYNYMFVFVKDTDSIWKITDGIYFDISP